MKIAVCIKMVPNSDQVKIDPKTHNLIREDVEMVINPSDMNALTEAIHIRELAGGTIDVFTMGIADAKNILYTALAIGADRAFLVTDRAFAGGDSLGTARVLAASVKNTDEYDLVLCGALSADGATGQVGPMMAELLGLSSVSLIKTVEEISEKSITVSKSYKGQKLLLELSMPCLFTVGLGVNQPVLPTLRSQMKAKKKEIQVITNTELGIDPSIIGKAGALSVVTDTYENAKSSTRSHMLEGDVTAVAKKIKDLMDEVMEKG